jgi:hypothetical protein
MDFTQGAAVPCFEIYDQGVAYHAFNAEGLTLQQGAQAFGEGNPDKTERAIQIRQVVEWGGAGPWETHTINAPPPAPLEALAWNQGGWPSWNGVDSVIVMDAGTQFNALDPEHWELERAVQDYWASYACENKEAHPVQIRRYTFSGHTEWVDYTVPLEAP